MLIKFYGALADDYREMDLSVSNVMQMLSGLRHVFGDELADTLLQNKYYYLLTKQNDPENVIALHPQMIMSEFGDYDTVLIIPAIAGETGIETGIAIATALGATGAAATAIGIAIAIAINIAISVALSFIMQLLSPTLSFDSDPSQAQKLDSSLFNGAPNIREQGGSVPIVVGNTHAGGVLISAGISSEEKTL
jgi:predicted phage tail protein